jgi:hypothetical protein
MTNPTHARDEPGIGRYYTHPITGERWPSVTNVNSTSVSKPALPAAAAKETAARAVQLLPQLVAASRKPATLESLIKEIKGHYRQLWAAAADRGDRVHALVEAYALGKPHPEDPEVEPYARQAIRFFEDFGIDLDRDVEAAEATVINRTFGYAGTGDLWAHIKINGKRQLALVDYKTGPASRRVTDVYPEFGLQVAALARAEKLLLDDGTEVDPPGPIEHAAILNLRPDSYALIPMPLKGTLDDAFAAFCSSVPHAVYLHSCYLAKPTQVPKPRLRRVA